MDFFLGCLPRDLCKTVEYVLTSTNGINTNELYHKAMDKWFLFAFPTASNMVIIDARTYTDQVKSHLRMLQEDLLQVHNMTIWRTY
jgi:hypothetical protein